MNQLSFCEYCLLVVGCPYLNSVPYCILNGSYAVNKCIGNLTISAPRPTGFPTDFPSSSPSCSPTSLSTLEPSPHATMRPSSEPSSAPSSSPSAKTTPAFVQKNSETFHISYFLRLISRHSKRSRSGVSEPRLSIPRYCEYLNIRYWLNLFLGGVCKARPRDYANRCQLICAH